MPSVADVIFIGLLAALVLTPLSVKLLGDAGIGWHIRTGQLILATHTIPKVDPFSSSMVGEAWFAWEWLYDVIVGQLEARLGLNGVVWLTAIVIALVFAGLFRGLVQRGVNVVISVLLTLLALSASTIHFLARPHLLSWLFTLIWFWILDASERRSSDDGSNALSRRRLWILPILMLVWVNVHGGFLVGFVLLAIFWIAAAWTWLSASDNRLEDALVRITAAKRLRDLLLLGLISTAASFLNPYGWKLHAHIYSYLTNSFLMNHIEEFQSPNFHGLAQKCFAILLVIVVGALAIRRRELHLSAVLTVLFAIYSGLYASRNIPVSSILLVLAIVPLLSSTCSKWQFFSGMQQIESNQRGHLWPIFAVVLTMALAANAGRAGSSTLMDAHFDPRRMPVEAVNYLQQHGVPGPLLSPDSWGGYLIYRLDTFRMDKDGIPPDRRVIIDDRHDLYGETFLKSYLKMMHVERHWQDFLREHEPSCVLLPRDAALANVLLETRQWKPIYSDETAIAFVPISK
jgi:hypothetical protein